MRINQKTGPGVHSYADSILKNCLIFMKNATNCKAEITAVSCTIQISIVCFCPGKTTAVSNKKNSIGKTDAADSYNIQLLIT